MTTNPKTPTQAADELDEVMRERIRIIADWLSVSDTVSATITEQGDWVQIIWRNKYGQLIHDTAVRHGRLLPSSVRIEPQGW